MNTNTTQGVKAFFENIRLQSEAQRAAEALQKQRTAAFLAAMKEQFLSSPPPKDRQSSVGHMRAYWVRRIRIEGSHMFLSHRSYIVNDCMVDHEQLMAVWNLLHPT